MQHMMIDLETMGTRVDAPVLSIGAVMFEPSTGELGDEFYVAIDPESALLHGKLSGSTLKWWMAQSDAARKAAMAGSVSAGNALADLESFYIGQGWSDIRVWGNGATFDISILEAQYYSWRGNKGAPWGFRNVRDCRTINELAVGLVGDTPRPATNVAHNALDDAIYQAKWVSAAWQALRPAA